MYKIFYILTLALVLITNQPQVAFAAEDECGTDLNNFGSYLKKAACEGKLTSGTDTPGTTASIIELIGGGLTVIISFVGILFASLLIYAGVLWLTARGNEEQVEKARGLIRNSIIGIVIVFTAFIVSREIVILVIEVTG